MERFFAPESVVLIGTSRQTGPGAYNNLETMVRYGYQGRIYLAHPKVPEIMGYKTYPGLAELPEVPDLAIISLGRDRVLAAAKECVASGIRRLVVISQGFADADARGKELQAELVALARKSGVRILGPNTMGIINPFASFSTAFIDVHREEPAPLTIVAQSGAFQVGYSSFTGRMGKAVDVGNACDLDVVDVLEYLEHDPETAIIVLHLEGIPRGRELLATAARIARHKPIISFKTGRSAAGAKAALSHTGSLVGKDALVDLAFARAGIIRVCNLVELLAVCQAFLGYRRPMQGPDLGMVTATGAFGIIAADACEDYGLTLAPFPEALRELEEERIPWHKLHNPVDLWPLGMVTGSFTGVFQKAAAGLLADEKVHAVLGVAPAFVSDLHSDLDLPGAVRALLRGNPQEKPLAVLFYGDAAARAAKEQELSYDPGVVCYGSVDEAVMGLAATWRYQQFLNKKVEPEEFRLPPAPADRGPRLAPGLVLGEAALELVQRYNLAPAPGVLAKGEEEAAAAAGELGFPVVLKIISPDWLHKSDRGGVRLHLADEAAVRQAYRELTERFVRQTPQGGLEGILVQQEMRGVELLLGLKKDPQFGPVLVAAAGGIYTEIMRDAAHALVPVDEANAAHMLASLKIYPMLQGVRGQTGVDLAAVTASLTNLSRLAVAYPEIRELDLNPVIANEKGCWVVDVRIVV